MKKLIRGTIYTIHPNSSFFIHCTSYFKQSDVFLVLEEATEKNEGSEMVISRLNAWQPKGFTLEWEQYYKDDLIILTNQENEV